MLKVGDVVKSFSCITQIISISESNNTFSGKVLEVFKFKDRISFLSVGSTWDKFTLDYNWEKVNYYNSKLYKVLNG